MLCEITIENVAVIEKATACFSEGFTVLTGETGAGKSILIDSINAILGNRVSRDIVRSGAAKAGIWARFEDVNSEVCSQLNEAGYPCDEGELLLYREISADGKSSCRINGMPATVAILKETCNGLIAIHGQHDNQSLMNPAKHMDVLDLFAQNAPLLAQYGEEYGQLSRLQKDMKALTMNESEKSRKVDLLRFELDEIEGAELEPGEEERLVEQREMVRHAQTILQGMNNAYYALSGGDEETGAATLLADAAREITAAAAYATELGRFADALNEAYYTVSEMATDIQDSIESFEYEGGSLEALENRLDVIYRLKNKYGSTVEAVIEYGEKAREQLEIIEFSAERLAGIQKQESLQREKVLQLAEALTASRQKAFKTLNTEIASALAFLNMPGITMTLHLAAVPCGPKGQDEIEFYIATNPGESPKPLAKIASGGELSRIMLALKSALADRDELPTVIYDEIDTGISGLAAGRIGKLLLDTAITGRQVICVTHTAQVAAYAKSHLLIEKQVDGGRTYTSIRVLAPEARVEELARIISGDNVTDIARANAEEMLRLANNA